MNSSTNNLLKFWKNKNVFITGVTGFKGSWLATTLLRLGANVTGYALAPNTDPNLFTILNLQSHIKYIEGDIRNFENLRRLVHSDSFDIVFHMAAQALVRRAYNEPIINFETNVMGTVSILDAIRNHNSIKAVINVTTDKCYINKNLKRGYSEDDELGGNEPYSASKACSEIVTAAYNTSYFQDSNIMLATARAGNVIGGGDWSEDRLIPDIMKALSLNQEIILRNPDATRPWLHVLEANYGYLLLAESLYNKKNLTTRSWNFGPPLDESESVLSITKSILKYWKDVQLQIITSNIKESKLLALDSNRSRTYLGWKSFLNINERIEWTSRWYQEHYDLRRSVDITNEQIDLFFKRIS